MFLEVVELFYTTQIYILEMAHQLFLSSKILPLRESSCQGFRPNSARLNRNEEPMTPSLFLESLKATLHISNIQTRHQLRHGRQFGGLLEARDQVLEHQFDFQLLVDVGDMGREVEKSQWYKSLMQKMRKFLVEAISNVVSAAFRFLCRNELEQKEAMEYASKNIILNIHSLLKQTYKALSRSPLTNQTHHQLDLVLIRDIDGMVTSILTNLADLYPQAPATGGTLRMREVINEVNRVDDEENDLILANGLKISDYFQRGRDQQGRQVLVGGEEADYTSFIMEVVNTAIKVTQTSQEDSRERTVRQIFTEFNEQLFYTCQQKHYQSMVGNLSDNEVQSPGSQQETKSNILDYFKKTLQTNEEQVKSLTRLQRKQTTLFEHSKLSPSKQVQVTGSGSSMTMGRLIAQSQEGVEAMKKEGKMAVGQKIPSYIQPFTRQQISNRIFSARHSSILRVLTKWADYLQDIFQHPQKHILQRLYPFKTMDNELVLIEREQQKQKLIGQIRSQRQQVQAKFQIILQEKQSIINRLLAEEQRGVSHVCRYSQVRSVSSQINAVLTSLMVRYTSILIDHLVRAGRDIETDKRFQDSINLVVFRVSDLLRAKFQCSEAAFITLLKTTYLLDGSEDMRGKFKLVRIKNKLDESSNNIMINYLFMGKVQCELQLSIQQPKGKEKHYYAFSHFVYELTRGKFGTIAQCAIMHSQLDPLITASKSSLYAEKIVQPKQKIQIHTSTLKSEAGRPSFFKCSQCHQLIISQNRDLFLSGLGSKTCNACIMKSPEAEQRLRNESLKSVLMQSLQKKSLRKMKNYQQLVPMLGEKMVVVLNEGGQLALTLAIFIKSQLKIFLVKISLKVLQEIDSPDFDFSQIDYLSIDKASKQSNLPELVYFVNYFQEVPASVFELMGLSKDLVHEKIGKVIGLFKQFRDEKAIIKTIKFKAEILNANSSPQKWKVLGGVMATLSSRRGAGLKYRRYKHLDLSNIKQIEANKAGAEVVETWLQKFKNLKNLSMNGNFIKNIQDGDLPTGLVQLSLEHNRIKQIDVSSLANLVLLGLSENNLSFVDVSQLTELTQLDLSSNQLTQIDLSHNAKLAYLNLTSNQLTQIDLCDLKHLAYLDLDHNPLHKIRLDHLISLTTFCLTNTTLEGAAIEELPNLVELDLSQNSLVSVDLVGIDNLMRLNISCNKIKQITLKGTPALQQLQINDNATAKVQCLPEGLQKLICDGVSVVGLDLFHLPRLLYIQICGQFVPEELEGLPSDAQLKFRK